jgi:hypothetical protein
VVTDIPGTATGHLNVGPGYDFFGQGTVDGFYRIPIRDLRYHFVAAVPEPPIWGMLLGGWLLVGLAAMRRPRGLA